jgi:hypothetical protein
VGRLFRALLIFKFLLITLTRMCGKLVRPGSQNDWKAKTTREAGTTRKSGMTGMIAAPIYWRNEVAVGIMDKFRFCRFFLCPPSIALSHRDDTVLIINKMILSVPSSYLS